MVKRQTIQALKIKEFLQSVKTHPSAESVYEAVKLALPTITLATVYRNLNQMVEAGEITKLEINNEFRFDANTKTHTHCVCKSCGKIIDDFQADIDIKKLKFNNFTPLSVNIIINGFCGNCGGK